jgi:hypothetical protein
MNRRTVTTVALCSTLLVASSAFVPTAVAGNVGWGVSVGGPGFSVSAGQPGYYGGRGFYGAPHFYVARPYYRPAYRVPVVAPPVAYSYYVPAPIVYTPRPVFHSQRPVIYGGGSY